MELMRTISPDVYEIMSRVRNVLGNIKLNEMYWIRNYVYVQVADRGDEYRAEIVTAEGLKLQVVLWENNGIQHGHVDISSVHSGSCNCECNGGGDY